MVVKKVHTFVSINDGDWHYAMDGYVFSNYGLRDKVEIKKVAGPRYFDAEWVRKIERELNSSYSRSE